MLAAPRNINHPFRPESIVVDADVRITVAHVRFPTEWLLDVPRKEFHLLHPDLDTAEETKSFLDDVFGQVDNHKAEFEPQEGGKLKLTLYRPTRVGVREAVLFLPQVSATEESILGKRFDIIQDSLEKVLLQDYHGEFSLNPKKCHNSLLLFNNNTVVRKKGTGQTGPHAGVLSLRRYNNEIVYWAFRIVSTGSRSVVMIGATSGEEVSLYAGANTTTAVGASLYGYNGYIYKEGTSFDYGLYPKQLKVGTYIGLLLDTKANTIQFSVNGEPGGLVTIPAHQDGYYVELNCHDGEECIEVLPHLCKNL